MFALVSVAGKALGTSRARVQDTAGFAQATHQPFGRARLSQGRSVGEGDSACPGAAAGSPGASWAGRWAGGSRETSLLAPAPAFPPALLFCSAPLQWLGAAPLPWGTAWLHPRGSHPTPSTQGAPQTQQDQPWGSKRRDTRDCEGLSTTQGCCPLPVPLTPLPAPILQVMLLGDSGVGKTCFLLQFKDGAFLSGTFIATVGIDFRVRPLRLPTPCLPQPTPRPRRDAGKGGRGVSSLCTPNNLPTSSRHSLKPFHLSLGER